MNSITATQARDMPIADLCEYAAKNPGALTVDCLAVFVHRLTLQEVSVGGPYQNENGQLDQAMNKNINYFFQTKGIQLPGLASFNKADVKNAHSSHKQPASYMQSQSAHILKERVYERAFLIIANYPIEVQDSLRLCAERMRSADGRSEVSLLAYYCCPPRLRVLLEEALLMLGVANVFCSLSYTIYDDIIDDDGGSQLPPTANIAMRLSCLHYERAASRLGVRSSYVHAAFDAMDQANTWELTNTRFAIERGVIAINELPRYKDIQILANRASGHILGPQLLARSLNLSEKSEKLISAGLGKYLIARQLNDDLRDWSADFRQGHISPIVSHLLQKLSIKPGRYSVDSLATSLQLYFWRSGFEELTLLLQKTLDEAESKLLSAGDTMASDLISLFLSEIRRSVTESLQIYKDNKMFARAYQSLDDTKSDVTA